MSLSAVHVLFVCEDVRGRAVDGVTARGALLYTQRRADSCELEEPPKGVRVRCVALVGCDRGMPDRLRPNVRVGTVSYQGWTRSRDAELAAHAAHGGCCE